MSVRSYVKLHDVWFTDDKIQSLIMAGRPSAVLLFFAAIGYSHAHDSDGYLSVTAMAYARRVTGGSTADVRALVARSMLTQCRDDDRSIVGYEIAQYARWQITSDQREGNAARMRQARARASRRASKKERERDRENARADARARHDDDDDPGIVAVADSANAVIARLRDRQRRERG